MAASIALERTNGHPYDFDEAAFAKGREALERAKEGEARAARRQISEQRAEEELKWQQAYNEYLRTSDWDERRRKVLERCNSICEACLQAPATEVHHQSYTHVGHEPCFELRGVCADCHGALHTRRPRVCEEAE